MPNTALTVKNVHQEIITFLGDSGVEVEIVSKDVEKALKDALRRYNRARPGRQNIALPVVSGEQRLLIEHPGFQGIVHVEFLQQRLFHDVDPFDPLSVIHPGTIYTGVDTIGDYDQRLQYVEQARRVASAEEEWKARWEIDKDTGEQKLFLYLDVPDTAPMLVSYDYAFHYTPDNDEQTGMQQIPDSDVDWIMDYTTARIKQTLGRIRGKFGGVADPTGGVSEIEGRELAAEGREDEKDLIDSLKRRRRPLPPVIE